MRACCVYSSAAEMECREAAIGLLLKRRACSAASDAGWSSGLWGKPYLLVTTKYLTLSLTLTLTRWKYGVITSELHTYNAACTQLRDFMQPAIDPNATYLNKGYNRRKVEKVYPPANV